MENKTRGYCKKSVEICLIAAILTLLISGCAKKQAKDSETAEMPEMEQKIVSFNLANYAENGFKKWDLKGDSADILAEIIYLRNISVDTYEEPHIKLTSDKGRYNRKDQIVFLDENVLLTTSDGLRLTTDSLKWDGNADIISTSLPVKIVRSDVIATGLGAKALPEMKKIILDKDVEVVLLRDAMGGASFVEETQKEESEEEEQHPAIITCDGPLEINYEENIAIFKDNVKVDDERGQIYSEVMEAYMDPVTKNILKVIAKGGVEVIRGEDSTYSERAIYTTADQKIVLLGKPKIFIRAEKEIEKVERGIKGAKR